MSEPYYSDDAVTLWHGDCLDVLRTLPDASVDAVVTDPPYLLGFMGREWDTKAGHEHLDWHRAWCDEAFRVLKPGGHLLAFGGTRTWHRLACAVEDAGFEVRDSIAWLYGSGFPKSLDVSKAIDKQRTEDLAPAAAVARWLVDRMAERGLERIDLNRALGLGEHSGGSAQQWTTHWTDGTVKPRVPRWEQWQELRRIFDLPADVDAEVWRLNGRKGKPGDNFEAREVLSERVVEVKGGSWAEQVDSGRFRIGEKVIRDTAPATPDAERWQGWGTALKPAFEPIVVARKPLAGTVAANVLEHGTGALNIDATRVGSGGQLQWAQPRNMGYHGGSDAGSVEALTSAKGRWPANVVLDESQAAALDRQSGESASRVGKPRGAANGEGWGMTATGAEYDDQGGASRFFPTFRYEPKAPTSERPRVNGVAHPTVKPLDLMRWLVRLVTPPGGTILDPFAGSGTTVEACIVEGFRCIAIEREDDYLPLITHRLSKPIAPALDLWNLA